MDRSRTLALTGREARRAGGDPVSDADAVIRTRGLSKSYGSIRALTELELVVPRHSIFGLLGPNGSGKSTAMKLLLGLVRPTSGRGSIFGLDIVQDSVTIRRRVGYLAQEPRFYGHLTAIETLRFVLRFFDHIPAADHDKRVASALEIVGLRGKANRPVRGLSGGERQRLGLAQAVIHDPDLLILDEPAAALDPMGRSDVLDILERLKERATVVYSTHILDDVQRVSDRVAILKAGRLVAQAPIERLLAAEQGASYELVLSGAPDGLRDELRRQAWIESVNFQFGATGTTWSVTVNDTDAAEASLLRMVLRHPEVRVLEFSRSRAELEDVFHDLVSGGDHDEPGGTVTA